MCYDITQEFEGPTGADRGGLSVVGLLLYHSDNVLPCGRRSACAFVQSGERAVFVRRHEASERNEASGRKKGICYGKDD